MSVDLAVFLQHTVIGTDEYRQVNEIACRLLAYLNTTAMQEAIALANMPGNSSALVQNTFLEFSQQLGFASERVGLFKNYPTRNFRPDYYRSIGQPVYC